VAVSSGGGGATKPKRARPNTLRQAASAVFALTAIVPLLLFVWAVHHLGGLSVLQAQVSLGLALAVALVGYFIFRGLMGRMSDLILSLGRVVELRERSGVGARASAEAPGPTVESAAGAGPWAAPSPTRAPGPPAATGAAEHAGVTAPPEAWITPVSSPPRVSASGTAAPWTDRPTEETHTVTGLGAIREVHDLSRAMGVLWRAEAIAYKGRRVAVSVLSSPRPVIGTLIELTDEGLLVQTDGSGRVAVSFTRISAIDAGELATED
jgi:hypothetical protein